MSTIDLEATYGTIDALQMSEDFEEIRHIVDYAVSAIADAGDIATGRTLVVGSSDCPRCTGVREAVAMLGMASEIYVDASAIGDLDCRNEVQTQLALNGMALPIVRTCDGEYLNSGQIDALSTMVDARK